MHAYAHGYELTVSPALSDKVAGLLHCLQVQIYEISCENNGFEAILT